MKPVDWDKVEELRRKGFYQGNCEFNPEEQSLLRAAVAEDAERYAAIGQALREEFAQSFRSGG